jgi:hypothetical protein
MALLEPISPATTEHSNGRPAWITVDLVAATLRTWQVYYREQLTERDAVAILQSVGGLIEVLERSP